MKPTLRQACSRPKPRAQFAFKDSMIHIICNSHYVSHFAAFFIDTGAKISVVESCLWFEGSADLFRGKRALGFRFDASRIGWGLVPAGAAGVVGFRRSLVQRTAPPDLADRPEPDRPGAGARSKGGSLVPMKTDIFSGRHQLSHPFSS